MSSLLGKPKVYAESTEKKVKITELPIYGEPEPPKVQYIPETISPYRAKVSVVRKYFAEVMSPLEGPIETVQQKWEVSKAHTNDLLDRMGIEEMRNKVNNGELAKNIKQDKEKLTFVAAGVLGGLVIGMRRGNIVRTLYGVTGGLSATAIAYPSRTVELVGDGWNRGKDAVIDKWNSSKESKKKD